MNTRPAVLAPKIRNLLKARSPEGFTRQALLEHMRYRCTAAQVRRALGYLMRKNLISRPKAPNRKRYYYYRKNAVERSLALTAN